MKKGFTLLELLVVVLIIGILAAVALPQYKMAIEKSQFATCRQMTRALAEAQERYYLANGTYATDFSALDVDAPGKYTLDPSLPTKRIYDWGYCFLQSDTVACRANRVSAYFQIYYQHSDGHWVPPGSRVCVAYSLNMRHIGNKLCKQETKKNTFFAQNTDKGYTEWLYPASQY